MDSSPPDVKDVMEFVKNILRENGVTKYEPALVDCLLQLACRNVTDLLESAAKLAQLSNPESSQITVEDLRLARQLQCETSKQRGGLEELLDKLAEEKNSVPLPTLRSNKGVALPPERH
ncbi:TFIID-31kDa domain containing protein, partial [Trichuris trichiura]